MRAQTKTQNRTRGVQVCLRAVVVLIFACLAVLADLALAPFKRRPCTEHVLSKGHVNIEARRG